MANDYRSQFSSFENVTYLNAATQGPIPLCAAREAQVALGWKTQPYKLPDGMYFDLPDRIREKAARVIGAQPNEIAVTTGASAGLSAVAAGMDWQPGDEILIARGEFPAHFSTWLQYQKAGKLSVRVVEPQGRFISADDYIAQIGPRTRLVSASLTRFDNGVRPDVARIGEACQKSGAAFLLDVTQCAGAMKINIRDLNASMAICSGYKWLLGPYGTGFFWVASEWIDRLPLGSVYFMALEGARTLHDLPGENATPAPGARRFDSAETANFTNLAAFDSAIDLVLRIGIDAVEKYIDALVVQIIERVPSTPCVLASPAERERRGPYVCISARSPEETAALYEKLRAEQIHVALRGGALRISPHIYNMSEDITRLMDVLSA